MNAKRIRRPALVALFAAVLLVASVALVELGWPSPWTEREQRTLLGMSLGSLPPLAPDPSNRFGNDERAARLGAQLFRDARLSGNGRVACSHCHDAERVYTDGRRVAEGAGRGRRNTPSVAPAAYGAWYFWDGRRDSQWAQALVPLESAAEQAGRRTDIARTIAAHYRAEYEAVFGALPELDVARFPLGASPLGSAAEQEAWRTMTPEARGSVNRVFANVGKSLAAYQRRLALRPARFDRYVEMLASGRRLTASRLLSAQELEGLRLFIGRARCVDCHRGPLFTSFEFFSLGLPKGSGPLDPGRGHVFSELETDPFNCLGRYSDAERGGCEELRFMSHDTLGFLSNFKTPSLRNVARTAPYMHDGQFESLDRVVAHYDKAPRVPFPEHSDIQPIGLSASERAALVAFLRTLDSDVEDPLAAR
jgi:cytochrome c peroxidase